MLIISNSANAQISKELKLSRFFDGYNGTFVMLDVNRNEYVVYNERQSGVRLSPCSTFKILNALIGLESGVIPDENFIIRWDGTKHPLEPWNRDHDLKTAFASSVVWYYQKLAADVGQKRMKKYVKAVNYGNKDISGGITEFWLNSSLKISAKEQVDFLYRLHRGRLPFSERSINIVKDIMKLSDSDGVILQGKTGTAGDAKRDIAVLGWFVGYVIRPEGIYIFAANIQGGKNPSGGTARSITKEILKSIDLL